jgi:hypothetical protein
MRFKGGHTVNRKLRLMGIGLGSALTISGCATLSKDQCLMSDWYEIGVQDGSAGYSPDRLAQHREACAEYRVRPDREAYRAGWDHGIGDYCTPERGYQEGRRGASYGQVCPPPLEWAFLQGYRNGQQVYQQEQRLRQLDQELERKKREIRQRDEERRKADDDGRRRNSFPAAAERPRNQYRQVQPVSPPVPIDDPAQQEQRRSQLERLKQQLRWDESGKPAGAPP